MSRCAEFVTFSVPGDESEYLDRRRAAIAEVKNAHPGLWSVPMLTKNADGRWTDVWIYETAEAAHAANADSGNLPAFLAMAELLADVHIEESTLADHAVAPL